MAFQYLDPTKKTYANIKWIALFDQPDDLATANIDDFKEGKMIPYVLEDSIDIVGDETSIEYRNDIEGKNILSIVTNGTFAISFFVTEMGVNTLTQLMGARSLPGLGTGETGDWIDDEKATVLGLNVNFRARKSVAFINDEFNKMILLPEGVITAQLGQDGTIVGMDVTVSAEDISTTNLASVTYIDLSPNKTFIGSDTVGPQGASASGSIPQGSPTVATPAKASKSSTSL